VGCRLLCDAKDSANAHERDWRVELTEFLAYLDDLSVIGFLSPWDVTLNAPIVHERLHLGWLMTHRERFLYGVRRSVCSFGNFRLFIVAFWSLSSSGFSSGGDIRDFVLSS
jgi:hypothetical protein